MFTDTYDEIVCDGLRPYYNAYWLPDKAAVYHCEDGFGGIAENANYSPDSFRQILSDCHAHIFNPDLVCAPDLLSYSRNFGIVLLKYLDMTKTDNFTVITGADVNYVRLDSGKVVSLQRYQRMTRGENKFPVDDFSIDFSGVLYHTKNIENDNKSIVSNLKDIFEKAGCPPHEEFASPQKDGEVIYMRQPKSDNIKTYTIELPTFIVMILVYFGILKSQRTIPDGIEALREIAEFAVVYMCDPSKTALLSDAGIIGIHIAAVDDIAEILATVDFDHEREHEALFAMPTKHYWENSYKPLMNAILDQNIYGNRWTELGKAIVSEWHDQHKKKETAKND